MPPVQLRDYHPEPAFLIYSLGLGFRCAFLRFRVMLLSGLGGLLTRAR
jgi:hypothetical protein